MAGPAASSTSTLTATPGSVQANNTNTTTLLATVNDAQGNPVSGQAVGFTATGTANTFSAPSRDHQRGRAGVGDDVLDLGRSPNGDGGLCLDLGGDDDVLHPGRGGWRARRR